MLLTPEIEGTVPIHSSAAHFAQAFRQRVAAGLLTGHPHPRSNYRVVNGSEAELRVRADDWWTAINVGLNEVDLRFQHSGAVHYRVRYWRWAAYAIGLSGVLGVIGLVLLLTLDPRAYLARHATARLPGFSIDQNLLIAWTMVLFWGFAWPWLLIALHKRPLRRLVERLVNQVDAGAAGR